MMFSDLIASISGKELNRVNRDNLKKLMEISGKFHALAKIPTKNWKVEKGSIVLESGHQPNFLPYPGVWRKVFLLDYMSNQLPDSIPVFGFFDFNLSTSKWLFQNRIPAINKNGFVTIGFTKPKNKDMWKRFNSFEKPSEKEWEKEVNKIYSIYGKNERVEEFVEEMWKSYELGEKFSDVNAILFARISSKFGFNVIFFRYSDVQNAGMFVDEWLEIVSNLESFNKIHNEAVEKYKLSDIGFVEENLAPFWYHCSCGGKVQMFRNGVFVGECSICGEQYEIKDVTDEFENLSPKAVMRNVVFAEGLKTSLFVSGVGGGLRYGLVANEVAKKFNMNLPVTLAWRGRDFYLGKNHLMILKEIERNLKISREDLMDAEKAFSKLEERRNELANADDEKLKGQYLYSATLLKMAASMFSIQPSIVDLFLSDYEIARSWRLAIRDAKVSDEKIKNNLFIINKNISYDNGISEIFDVVLKLNEMSSRIDPLKILTAG